MQSMRRYALSVNYIQLISSDRNKGENIYIDGRPKISGNIIGFINNTQPGTTNKEPNCIDEGCEENRVVMCAIKKIPLGEELLVDYHLNRVDTTTKSVQVLNMQHQSRRPLLVIFYI